MDKKEAATHLFKIIIIGDAGVGKSNLMIRYVKDEFDSAKAPTVGVEFQSKVVKVDNDFAKLQIWDTAGQEKFKATSKQYFRNAAGVILVYDITKKKSFENLSKYVRFTQVVGRGP